MTDTDQIDGDLTVAHVLDLLGGTRRAAEITGSGRDTPRKWRQLGFIPARHWAAVVEAADGRVTFEALARLASGARSDAA